MPFNFFSSFLVELEEEWVTATDDAEEEDIDKFMELLV